MAPKLAERGELDAFLGKYDPKKPKGNTSLEVCRGLSVRRNIRNPFLVATLRYIADPDKDPETGRGFEWLLQAQKEMGCVRVCRTCDLTHPVRTKKCPVCSEETELILSNRWRREMEIDYGAQSGAYVFTAFSKGRNTCDPFRIPAGWRRYRLLDHGFRNPSVCLWIAVDPDAGAWVYAEHYEAGQSVGYHARRIHEISADTDYHALGLTESDLRIMLTVDWEPSRPFLKRCATLYRTLGDPSMGARISKETKTIKHRYAENGIYVSAANRANAGIETLNAMFGENRLTVFNTCENTIREVSGLVWEEHQDPSKNLKEKEVDRDNHTTDCLRYFANAFAPPAIVKEEKDPVVTSDDRAVEMREEFRQRHARMKRQRGRDDILKF